MKELLKIAVFVILTLFLYAYVGNIIPQVSSGPEVVLGHIERNERSFVKAGEQIFYGKGKCATCHSIGPSATARCPDLENIGTEAANRNPPMTAKEYLIESLYDPDAYVIKGYGKIMPPAWKPPLALSSLEIETVIAFMQSLGGRVDLTPFEPPVQVASAVAEMPERKLMGDVKRGLRIFEEKMKCISCHRVYGRGGEGVEGEGVGPDLSNIGALNTVDYIEESILYPNVLIVKGFAWATVRLKDGRKVEGTMVQEDEESITLKIEGDTMTIFRDDIKERKIRRPDDLISKGYFWVRASLKDGDTAEGNLIEESEEDILLKIEGENRRISKGDIAHLSGKRIRTKSKMPGNYGYLLRVNEFNDLLAYVASLKGEPVAENP